MGFLLSGGYPGAGAILCLSLQADSVSPVFRAERRIGVGVGLQVAGHEVGSQRHLTCSSTRVWLAPLYQYATRFREKEECEAEIALELPTISEAVPDLII